MKRKFELLKISVVLVAATSLSLGSCKKKSDPDPEPEPPATTATRAELTKDSILLYAQQVYYWNEAMPTYEDFKPRRFTTKATELENYEQELFELSQRKLNPTTGKPYEFVGTSTGANAGYPKYSYIFDTADKNPTAYVPSRKSSVDLLGNGNDLGLKIGLYGSTSSYSILVQAVYPGSDAAAKGMSRGDTIKTIDGRSIGSSYNAEIDFIISKLSDLPTGSSVTLTGKTKANTAFNVNVTKKVFKSSPIYKDAVLTAGNTKVGYISYARFSNSENSGPEFTRIFTDFKNKNVTALIVDLRYNGGGYVNTAESFVNHIAQAAFNDRVMYVEHFNSTMQQGRATILSKQPVVDGNNKPVYINGRAATYADYSYSTTTNTYRFKKEGPLDGISKVVFIVSGSTASASELVINSLKPHITVKLVGAKTYGKPIGFFPMRIDKYDVYYSMFATQNSVPEGNYFDGFAPDLAAADDFKHDFGDPDETAIKAALKYLDTGILAISAAKTSARPAGILEESQVLLDTEFKGMIETPSRRKLK
jgi:carboxyl-terminal processing protease